MTRLLAAAFQQPDFADDQVKLVRSEQLGGIAESANDTRAVSDRALRRALYPAPNPLGRFTLGKPTAWLRSRRKTPAGITHSTLAPSAR